MKPLNDPHDRLVSFRWLDNMNCAHKDERVAAAYMVVLQNFVKW